MKNPALSLKTYLLPLLLLCTINASARTLPDYSTQYDSERDAYADGLAAIQLASNTNRKVLIEVGGDWCAWCHILDRFLLTNQDIYTQLHDTFVILKVNVSEDNDNAEFLRAFPKALGYPHMYITDHRGKILWSQDTAEFLDKGKYSRQRILAFIAKWKQHE